eukprot:m.64595 g.64595  ORF g.64595 m.64595 type:complete len:130 (-) comp13500_c1_seq1:1595-1984(-)
MLAMMRGVRAAGRCVRAMSTAPSSFDITSLADFNTRVLAATTPVIVDFTASWCGPCRMLKPILEKQVAAQDGKVLLAKVDIDKNQDLAFQFRINSVPTVIAFKNGEVVDGFMGLKGNEEVSDFIAALLD